MSRGQAWAFLAVASGVVLLSSCGKERPEPPSEPDVLVIEDPRSVIVSGTDTVPIYAPTIFAYVGIDLDQPPSGAGEAQQMLEFQQALQATNERLRAAGVRIRVVDRPPVVVSLPENAPGAGVDPHIAGTFGYLLVDAPGHLRKIDGPMEAAALACAAASTFGVSVAGC